MSLNEREVQRLRRSIAHCDLQNTNQTLVQMVLTGVATFDEIDAEFDRYLAVAPDNVRKYWLGESVTPRISAVETVRAMGGD